MLNGKQSQLSFNNTGVLQGAILSPFLFSLYIDNLKISRPHLLYKYADDLVLIRASNNISDTAELQTMIDYISAWSSERSLYLNPSKCRETIFSLNKGARLRNVLPPHARQVDDTDLEIVDNMKYLGVTISANLTWTAHMWDILSKIRKLSYFIKRLLSFQVPVYVLHRFVYACALPILLNCSPVIFSALL
jgi:hypothetical protein